MNKKQLIISSIIVVVLAVVAGIIGFKLGRGKDDAEPKEQTVADGSAGKEQDTDDKKPGKTEAAENNNQTTAESKAEATESKTEAGSNNGKENGGSTDSKPVVNAVSTLDTGNLTETGNGYEGTKGTGNFNYGEALQKSILFYELQRSVDLPEQVRCNWRGDSGLTDGSDAGLDLTGGWYDAGDHVKFNLPMAYSAAMLSWSVYEDRDAYEESGQLDYILADIKWATDYLIKCHPEDEVFYYQVGDGGADHSWWGPAEVMSMNRPSYKVTKSSPGSAVTGEAAAALAAASVVFKDSDPEYSALCLKHAKSLYAFSEDTKSDSGYTAANGFYNSWSGFYDELAWAGAWLYISTGDDTYLKKAEAAYPQAGQDFNWSMCWDDVHIGAAVLLAQLTGDKKYTGAVEKHLDYWTTGTSDGEKIKYTPKGLAWLDQWGSLRYATTTAFIASVYSESKVCPDKKKDTYWKFAVSQADYALGSTGFSYMIGFGDNFPRSPHHRTANGSSTNNLGDPAQARHTLYGALVGGPDANDGYTDETSNYTTNEVACDYNAGFTGLLAKLYTKYHGETLKDFGAVEVIDEYEMYVEGGINVDGKDFVEIKAFVYNISGWPARKAENLELRYYVDLSEVYEDGKTVSDIQITTNYMQSGEAKGLLPYDEEKHIYYLSVEFKDGNLYPGGQEHYRQEIQVRMRNPEGAWDNSNDPSFNGLTIGNVKVSEDICLYENGKLIFGNEP